MMHKQPLTTHQKNELAKLSLEAIAILKRLAEQTTETSFPKAMNSKVASVRSSYEEILTTIQSSFRFNLEVLTADYGNNSDLDLILDESKKVLSKALKELLKLNKTLVTDVNNSKRDFKKLTENQLFIKIKKSMTGDIKKRELNALAYSISFLEKIVNDKNLMKQPSISFLVHRATDAHKPHVTYESTLNVKHESGYIALSSHEIIAMLLKLKEAHAGLESLTQIKRVKTNLDKNIETVRSADNDLNMLHKNSLALTGKQPSLPTASSEGPKTPFFNRPSTKELSIAVPPAAKKSLAKN